MKQNAIIVMGVSGTGNSTVGEALAKNLNAKFIDGDDLHPRANIQKMARREPLNDTDRQPWLERISDAVFSLEHKNECGVIVCSALKKAYRDRIRHGNQQLVFVFLDGSRELIMARMQARKGHFMKPAMLDSQFAALERPQPDEVDILTVSIDTDIDTIVMQAAAKITAYWQQG